jgi:acetyl-CoA C-acetyltransferase
MASRPAYVIAARRTALGRVGGLHRQRRIEDLAAPLTAEVLKDAGVSPARVDHVLLGNVTAGGNSARLVALAAGLPDSAPAMTIDQHAASGLAAIVFGMRMVNAGEASVVVAGGAEAISMAPWRMAKPRGVHQTPRFIGPGGEDAGQDGDLALIESGERLARRLGLTRELQDEWAYRSHLAASLARDARRLQREILPLKATADEARDQSATEPDLDELRDLAPIRADGTLTPGNTSAPHDGAAVVLIVSQDVWDELGKPAGMQLRSAVTVGVSPEEEIEAPIVALQRMLGRVKGVEAPDIDVVELGESSAVQALAVRNALGLSDGSLNPDGGAIVRGLPIGAAGAVLVARLFTRLARVKPSERQKLGAAVLGAAGGLGMAALFERV